MHCYSLWLGREKLTDRTGSPAACRVTSEPYQYPYLSSFPSQTDEWSPNISSLGCGRDSQWYLPLIYSLRDAIHPTTNTNN